MSRGDGRHFKQKGQHVWTIAYYAPGKDGRRVEHRESARTRDEKEAIALLKRRVRESANHEDGKEEFNGPRARRVTVAELLDAKEAAVNASGRKPGSIEREKYRMGIVRERFGHFRAAAVRAQDLRDYIVERRAAGRADKSIKHDLALLLSAFRLGVNDKILAAFMVPEIEMPSGDNVRQGFFERRELEALLPHLSPPLDDVARFGYDTGWRRGMILELKWAEVDRINGVISLPGVRTKNGKPISVPMDEVLAAIIARRLSARSLASDFVFHRGGKELGRNTFMKAWHTACVKAGLGKYVTDETKKGKRRYVGKIFHDFRRTAARDMIRSGVPQAVAMEITGHRTASMFQRYNIVSEEQKLEALRRRNTV
jgi:integrase